MEFWRRFQVPGEPQLLLSSFAFNALRAEDGSRLQEELNHPDMG